MTLRAGCLAFLLLLAACGSDRSPYGGTQRATGVKLGKPYTIMGQYYEPRYDPEYTEEGMASWYGPGFHGRMTASGERFDTNDLTAAHRTLPMPSLVRVTMLSNGKSVIARVNDRGPFKKSRIIDLSSAAADGIGMKGAGSAMVRVEYLPEATEKYLADIGLDKPDWMTGRRGTPKSFEQQYATIAASTGVEVHPAEGPAYVPDPVAMAAEEEAIAAVPTMSVSVSDSSPFSEAPAVPVPAREAAPFKTAKNDFTIHVAPAAKPVSMGGQYFVQTAAFKTEQNAKAHAERIRSMHAPEIRQITVGGEPFYRVMLGPLEDDLAAKQMLERAKAMGFTDARILIQ